MAHQNIGGLILSHQNIGDLTLAHQNIGGFTLAHQNIVGLILAHQNIRWWTNFGGGIFDLQHSIVNCDKKSIFVYFHDYLPPHEALP